MQTLHFSDDARMRIWYIFCRSKSPVQHFVKFSLNVMKLEYTAFIRVWASSRIRLHFVQRKYTMFVVCWIQNRLAVRCFDDDCLQTSSENANNRKSHLTRQGRARNHYERSVWRKKSARRSRTKLKNVNGIQGARANFKLFSRKEHADFKKWCFPFSLKMNT